jgi:hypothetical protein
MLLLLKQLVCSIVFCVVSILCKKCVASFVGHVYAYEAVKELNLKAKNMTDLLTGEAFTKVKIV